MFKNIKAQHSLFFSILFPLLSMYVLHFYLTNQNQVENV